MNKALYICILFAGLIASSPASPSGCECMDRTRGEVTPAEALRRINSCAPTSPACAEIAARLRVPPYRGAGSSTTFVGPGYRLTIHGSPSDGSRLDCFSVSRTGRAPGFTSCSWR